MLSDLTTFKIRPASLRPKVRYRVETHITRLNDYLNFFDPRGQVSEWGAPHGNFSRAIPAIIAQALKKECLWISDRQDLKFYPTSWFDFGFDLAKIHFMVYEKPFKIIRAALDEETYELLIIDSGEFISPAELNYLAHSVRQKNISIFLLRHFFLSNRNGNPFAKFRFNSNFSLRTNCFTLHSVKGKNTDRLKLKLNEVFSGGNF